MAIVSTATVTVNAAFLQEIKEVHQELWDLLDEVRHLTARPISLRSQCRKVVEMLSQLRDQLALHFALEEAYGYFDDPVAVAPRLCEAADSLRAEHGELYLLICELAEQAESWQRSGRLASLATHVSRDFQQFDRRLQIHEARENDLILAEYDDDIGVGD